MVERLSEGPASVSDLAEPMPMSLPGVLQHLRVLEQSGLVRSEKVGRVRTYRIEAAAMRPAERWISGGGRAGSGASTGSVYTSPSRATSRKGGVADDRAFRRPRTLHHRAHLRRLTGAGLRRLGRPRQRPAVSRTQRAGSAL